MLLTQLIIQHPSAIAEVVRHTPPWVAGLLAALVALGLSAVRDRNVHIGSLVLMPLAMLGLALWGVQSAFGGTGQLVALLALWLLGYGAVAAIGLRLAAPAGTRYDPASRRFRLPGSWAPMVLILAVFLMKYVIGVQLAMEPALATQAGFALVVTGLYGVLSGVFTARTLRVLRLAYRRPCRTVAA